MILTEIFNNLDPKLLAIITVVFVITFYLSFTYINKDNKDEDTDYKIYIYSLIPSIITTCISFYFYNTYKPKNNLLEGGYFDN